jgi:mRNA interferase HigB
MVPKWVTTRNEQSTNKQTHMVGMLNNSDFWNFVLIFRIFFVTLQKISDGMRIIAKSTLVAYYTKNPQSKAALEDWYEKTKAAEWKCFADMRQTFNSVDSVGNKRYVFNIKGNDYRLVVLVKFTVSHVLIRFVGTHSEYDKITDIQHI